SMGNCAYDTTVSVKAGASPGFSSDNVTFGVNSPQHVRKVIGWDYTEPYYGGYWSHVHWEVGDVCGGGTLTTLPMNEVFGPHYFMQNEIGWTPPSAESAAGFNVTATVFEDNIWATCVICFPATTWTTWDTPFVYYDPIVWESQSYYVGTESFGSGASVYSGTQTHFRDHGTTVE
ncbi:MAG: hypothetical protein ABL962_18370, partial [Fimbriimonadaceae bacterium]